MAVLGSNLSRKERMFRAGLASALVLALWSIFMLGPEGFPLPSCLFRELTGTSCLTCGLTRSLQAASLGHLRIAAQFHLLGPFILAGLLIATLACVAEASIGRSLLYPRRARGLRYTLAGSVTIWIVYGVARAIVELT
jgi:hypothetical protein